MMMDTQGKGYIADYKPFNFVDGEGVRCSLYVSGCHLHCPHCFNKKAQSFSYGHLYDEQLEEQILADLSQSYVQGLSLLGGEPFLNLAICLPLVKKVKAYYPTKDIWVWSGFSFEELKQNYEQCQLLNNIDVLVDGPYIEEKKILNQSFYGSSNQRIIDVQSSLQQQSLILWKD